MCARPGMSYLGIDFVLVEGQAMSAPVPGFDGPRADFLLSAQLLTEANLPGGLLLDLVLCCTDTRQWLQQTQFVQKPSWRSVWRAFKICPVPVEILYFPSLIRKCRSDCMPAQSLIQLAEGSESN